MTHEPKPHLNIPVSEQELKTRTKAVGGARVTEAQVEAFITQEHFFTAGDGVFGAAAPSATVYDSQLDILTFCVLVLANGYTVHGISACADPKMFDADIGKRLARADAKNKVWGLLGFELRSKLALVEAGTAPSFAEQTTHVGIKVIHSVPMNRVSYNALRGWDLPADENGDDEGYLVEYADGGEANVPGFAGYVSWSPKAVFEKAYGPIGVRLPPATA
jgi:hypothetical protein